MRTFIPTLIVLPSLWSLPALAQTPEVKIATFSDIASDCGCDVDQRAGDTDKDFIEFALSTMWIDAWETEEVRSRGQLFLTGEVETENGTRDMVATLVGKGDKREVRVALSEVGALNQSAAMERLSGKTISKTTPRPKAKTSKPKAKPKAAAPKLKTAANVKTNPFVGIKYPAPEIVKSGKYSQKIGNWPQTDGVMMAKPGDKFSPRLTERSFPFKRKQSDKALVDAALKDAGLTRA